MKYLVQTQISHSIVDFEEEFNALFDTFFQNGQADYSLPFKNILETLEHLKQLNIIFLTNNDIPEVESLEEMKATFQKLNIFHRFIKL